MWSYVAVDSVQRGARVEADAKSGAAAGRDVYALVRRLQDERRATAEWQNRPTREAQTALHGARSRTDGALAVFRSSPAKTVNTAKRQSLTKALDRLKRTRNRIDTRAANRRAAYGYYTTTTEAATTHLTDVLRSSDGQLAHTAATVTTLTHVGELLSQEDALLTTAQSSGHMAPTLRQSFVKHVASQREVTKTLNTGDMPPVISKKYREIADTPQWAVLQHIENTVSSHGYRKGSTASREAEEWRSASDAVTRSFRDTTSSSLNEIADQGADRADDKMLTAVVGSAAVVVVLLLTLLLAVRPQRSLFRRLRGLKESTTRWTESTLPESVDRYKRGDYGGTVPETPDGQAESGDEVGRLREAIRRQQRTTLDELSGLAQAIDERWRIATQTSEQQARKRSGAETVVLGLLRRNQMLVNQLISRIDGLERREHDPELLTEIFRIDHLVTRLRRDLENQSLIVGVQPGRRWSKPVPVFQVLRSAVAETVDYTRVEVETAPDLSLTGRVVADVGHVLAALIENGTSFSPPHTNVSVRAEEVAEGRLAIEVIDRGLGMTAEKYEQLNRLLANPPTPDVTQLGEIPQLGLLVVGLLAHHIGLEITLCKSAYGGTKAVVLIPSELLEEAPALLPNLSESGREPIAPHCEADDAESGAPEPEDNDLGGYPAYTGGGLLTQSRTLPRTEIPEISEPAEAPSAPPEPEIAAEPAVETPMAEAAPPTGDQPTDAPPQPERDPSTGLPTRRPGENLAAPLRRRAGNGLRTQTQPPRTDDRTSMPSIPDKAGAVAGAVQRGSRKARSEPSEAQSNGVSPGEPRT